MGGDCEVFSTSILETSFNGYKWLICLGCLMCLIQATHLLDKTVPMLFLPPFLPHHYFLIQEMSLCRIFPFGNINGFHFSGSRAIPPQSLPTKGQGLCDP